MSKFPIGYQFWRINDSRLFPEIERLTIVRPIVIFDVIYSCSLNWHSEWHTFEREVNVPERDNLQELIEECRKWDAEYYPGVWRRDTYQSEAMDKKYPPDWRKGDYFRRPKP